MANYRNAPGKGNPYEGTGFTNLDAFLNTGNLGWGSQQSGEPATMDMAHGRSQPASSFERWMYGASDAPEKNSEKQDSSTTSPFGAKGEDKPTASPFQPSAYTIDNFPFDAKAVWDEIGKYMNPISSTPEQKQAAFDARKKAMYEEFMKTNPGWAPNAGQTQSAPTSTAPAAKAPTQTPEPTVTPTPTIPDPVAPQAPSQQNPFGQNQSVSGNQPLTSTASIGMPEQQKKKPQDDQFPTLGGYLAW